MIPLVSSWHRLGLSLPLLAPHVHGGHAAAGPPGVAELLRLLHRLRVDPLLPGDPDDNSLQPRVNINSRHETFVFFWWKCKYLPNIHPCRKDDDQEEAAPQPETNEAEIWLKLALLHLLISWLGNIFQWMIHFTSETRFVLICLAVFFCFFFL